jgi:hypothetical protein
MRSLFLSIVLGLVSLGLVGLTPQRAEAQWPRYSGYYYPSTSYYYSAPYYSGYYYPRTYSYPGYSGYYYPQNYSSYYYPGNYSSYYYPGYGYYYRY